MNDNKEKFRAILTKYLPELAVEPALELIFEYQVFLRITRDRTSKLGDFRSPMPGEVPKLTVNHTLNRYAFLITFIHELAHAVNWLKYENNPNIKPHGKEWKYYYKILMRPFLRPDIFPTDILIVLNDHMQNPSASSSSNIRLNRVLKKYDKDQDKIFVESLPEKSKFILNGILFQKGTLRRKRFECLDLATNRLYLVSPIAEVTVWSD